MPRSPLTDVVIAVDRAGRATPGLILATFGGYSARWASDAPPEIRLFMAWVSFGVFLLGCVLASGIVMVDTFQTIRDRSTGRSPAE